MGFFCGGICLNAVQTAIYQADMYSCLSIQHILSACITLSGLYIIAEYYDITQTTYYLLTVSVKHVRLYRQGRQVQIQTQSEMHFVICAC